MAARRNGGPTDLGLSVEGFLGPYLINERGCSDATVASYARTVTAYLLFVEGETGTDIDRLTLSCLTAKSVRAFLDGIEASGCSTSTRNQRLAALRSLSRYAARENACFVAECQRICGIHNKNTPKGEVDYLEADAMAALLAAPDRSTVAGRRAVAVLSTLYDTGARVQELIDLELKNIRLRDPRSATLTGKGNKTRTVTITSKTADLVLAHLADRGIDPRDQPYLSTRAFCPPGRSHYTRQGISRMANAALELARRANPDMVFPDSTHPHAFRASKAIHMLDAGVSIIALRDILGHESVSTTERYLRVRTDQKRRAVEEAYPSLAPAPDPNWREDSDLMSLLRKKCRGGK